MSNKSLFENYKLGDIPVKSRIGMAALTRQRIEKNDGVPTDIHVKYYTDRAEDAGFVLTECTSIEREGNQFIGAPGIYNKDQIEGWKKVVDSVHQVNGIIILQIWHCGRTGTIENLGVNPIGPSNIKNRHKSRRGNEFVDNSEPRELKVEEIKYYVDLFERCAMNAKEAGFDGIQLHGANGYLVDNFIRDCSNQRNDEYGGSIENRCRFPIEVMDRMIKVFGAGRVGIKISPCGRFNDMFDSDPEKTYGYLLKELGKRKIAFVEASQAPDFRKVDNLYGIDGEDQIKNIFKTLKGYFVYEEKVEYEPTFIANNGIDLDKAKELLENNECDMITFGRLYISNPDLTYRLKNGIELTPYDYSTFYTLGEEGYNTYKKYIDNKIFMK